MHTKLFTLFSAASLTIGAFAAPASSAAADTALAFLTAYSNMDYDSLAALTSDDFSFSDAAYPLIEGDVARGMYRWFIHDKEKTQMKVIIHDVQPSPTDANTAIASFTDDYLFNGNHVINNITSTMVVTDGKLLSEKDSYSFAAWAEQALGPVIGPLAAPLSVTQGIIQVTAKVELDSFLLFNPL
ncbi:hypothetical protein C8F04DRAFT_1229920 [Mycena alexandri]|uniref:SnoaL-like domain-containing protein n=1 Tax=Mycena alexandri TaxID=1745969 RepID=A0AAD6T9T7_9AGAR|nr:hypothetical protein C8F04DRAFT_1229920 [Mycena alexandri]